MKTTSPISKPVANFKPIALKSVLIALDYDTTARQVAEKGYSLAKSMNAEVTLLHVVTDEPYYSSLEYSPLTGFTGFDNLEFAQQISTKGLIKASHYFLDKIKVHLADESVQTRVEKGDIAEVILLLSRHLDVDIIIMGSHSRRWLDQILMGSVTEKVLKTSRIPLFIIPTKGGKSK